MLPVALHTRVRQEQEKAGMTLGEYVEAMITEYYDWKDGKIMTGEMRTLAAQIPAELFDRLDRYLKARGIKKKDFLVDIITRALEEAADAAEMPPVQKNSRPDWLLPFSDSEDDKPVKLLYSSKRKDEITEALGNRAQYKEKESGTFTAAFYAEEIPQFFGWLAGLGRDAVIVKPKKAVQAYRDYLKGILKEYK